MYPIYTAQNVHFGWNEKVIGFVQSLKYYDSIVKKEAEKVSPHTLFLLLLFIPCVQRSWITLAGESPVTVIASEPCS